MHWIGFSVLLRLCGGWIHLIQLCMLDGSIIILAVMFKCDSIVHYSERQRLAVSLRLSKHVLSATE